jgi:Flp pilus assembly pilin Flp
MKAKHRDSGLGKETGRLAQNCRSSIVNCDRGATALEWTLILACFVLVLLIKFPGMPDSVAGMLIGLLSDKYQMVSFLETLPFP